MGHDTGPGAPALVTGDADQPAVTAPAPAVYTQEVYSCTVTAMYSSGVSPVTSWLMEM